MRKQKLVCKLRFGHLQVSDQSTWINVSLQNKFLFKIHKTRELPNLEKEFVLNREAGEGGLGLGSAALN